jgi:hypothetical protein
LEALATRSDCRLLDAARAAFAGESSAAQCVRRCTLRVRRAGMRMAHHMHFCSGAPESSSPRPALRPTRTHSPFPSPLAPSPPPALLRTSAHSADDACASNIWAGRSERGFRDIAARQTTLPSQPRRPTGWSAPAAAPPGRCAHAVRLIANEGRSPRPVAPARRASLTLSPPSLRRPPTPSVAHRGAGAPEAEGGGWGGGVELDASAGACG